MRVKSKMTFLRSAGEKFVTLILADSVQLGLVFSWAAVCGLQRAGAAGQKCRLANSFGAANSLADALPAAHHTLRRWTDANLRAGRQFGQPQAGQTSLIELTGPVSSVRLARTSSDKQTAAQQLATRPNGAPPDWSSMEANTNTLSCTLSQAACH